MDRCTSARPDSNAKFHKLEVEGISLTTGDFVLTQYICLSCGRRVETKNHDILEPIGG